MEGKGDILNNEHTVNTHTSLLFFRTQTYSSFSNLLSPLCTQFLCIICQWITINVDHRCGLPFNLTVLYDLYTSFTRRCTSRNIHWKIYNGQWTCMFKHRQARRPADWKMKSSKISFHRDRDMGSFTFCHHHWRCHHCFHETVFGYFEQYRSANQPQQAVTIWCRWTFICAARAIGKRLCVCHRIIPLWIVESILFGVHGSSLCLLPRPRGMERVFFFWLGINLVFFRFHLQHLSVWAWRQLYVMTSTLCPIRVGPERALRNIEILRSLVTVSIPPSI